MLRTSAPLIGALGVRVELGGVGYPCNRNTEWSLRAAEARGESERFAQLN